MKDWVTVVPSLADIGEGLVEAELVVEGDGGGDVLDADGDVGDAVHGRDGGGRGGSVRRAESGRGEWGEARGEGEQGDAAERGG